MTPDEQEIRDLIQRWAAAVHAGDLDGVTADHAGDIVMFDVPPPDEGIRGLGAYRGVWPGFLEWQGGGAVFEIVSLDITAGADVAFAHALVRCDDPAGLKAHPERRLRLTLGLTKRDGRWEVAHEHHSFPVRSDEVGAEAAVRAIHDGWTEATAKRDLEALMEGVADDVVSYEHAGPLAYNGKDEVREVCRTGLDVAGEVDFRTPDLAVEVTGDLAVTWGIDEVRVATPEGVAESRSRATRVFRRSEDGWRMVHQHLSFPVQSR